MKTVIHVNQHNIKANAKGSDKPVLTVKSYKSNRKGNVAGVFGSDGQLVGKFIYRPEKPLPCGAKVWFETENDVVVYDR